MKKIIDDLLYDTETANLIHFDEDKRRSLYMTSNGNFFMLFITGEIRPKTEESVKEYLGRVNVKKYIEIFGEPEKA